MSKHVTFSQINGEGKKIGIVRTRWNAEIIDQLFNRATAGILASGVKQEDIVVVDVPGCFELPVATQHLIQKEKVDAVVALGCLIKGETMHFEYIADAVSHGLMTVGLTTGTPVIFGVLTCLSQEQAETRASQDGKDHGYEWGLSVVEMAVKVS